MKIEKSLKQIIDALIKGGGHPYLVGGSVRDYLLGKKNKDYDIEVYRLDKTTLKSILNSFGKIDLAGEKFGVYKLGDYEFALPRREKKCGKRHQDFIIETNPFLSTPLASKRRDFTINALMYDLINGEILDFYSGLTDLKMQILRPISISFKDDPLRLLRAFRFASQLNFKISEEIILYSKDMSLKYLSLNYLVDEVEKAFKGLNPQLFLDYLKLTNHFEDIFPNTNYRKNILAPAFYLNNYVKMMQVSNKPLAITKLIKRKSLQKESLLWLKASEKALKRSELYFIYEKSAYPLELSNFLDNKILDYPSYLELKATLIKAEEVIAKGFKGKDINIILKRIQSEQIETGSVEKARNLLTCIKMKSVN